MTSAYISPWLRSLVAPSVGLQGVAGIGKVSLRIAAQGIHVKRDSRSMLGWYADPYATGEASYLSVKGIQDAGVQACSK